MICDNCGEAVGPINLHRSVDHQGNIQYFCSSKAERSEVLQGCPPSATGCPDAGAVGQADADSSGRCPENSGMPSVKSADAYAEIGRDQLKKADAMIARGGHGAAAQYRENAKQAFEQEIRLREMAYAHQCNGERALPANGKSSDPL